MSLYTPPPFPHPTRQAPSPPPFSVHATPSHDIVTTISRDSAAKLLAVRYSDNTPGKPPYTERSAWDRDDDEKTERNQGCGMRKRKSWVLLLVIVGIVLAIAVGAGVGVSMVQRAKNGSAESDALVGMEGISSSNTASPSEIRSTASFSRFGNSSASATDAPSSTVVETQATSPSISQEVPSTATNAPSSTAVEAQATSFSTSQGAPPSTTAPPTQNPSADLSTTLTTATTTRTCPSPTACDSAGCAGRNNADKAILGYCTAGENVGCGCTSVCGVQMGSCSGAACLGVDGLCGVGEWMGCPCAP